MRVGLVLAAASCALAAVSAGADARPAATVACPRGTPFVGPAVAFAPRGDRLAYARSATTLVVETLGGRVLGRRALGALPTALAWAPAGGRIAYVSGGDLHVVGHADLTLFHAAPPLALGGWTPDGRSILVSAGTLPEAETFLVDAGDGAARDLGPGAEAVLAPDGTRAAVAVATPGAAGSFPAQAQALQVVELADGARTTIFRSAFPLQGLAWSPDSRRVAFLWDIDVEPDLMAQNADGSSTGLFGREHGALPTQVGMLPPLRWTRRGIVGNAALEDGGTTVLLYDVAGGRARYVRAGRSAALAGVARDGSTVAYGVAPPGQDVGPLAAARLRLVDWTGRHDRALEPCRGSGRRDRIAGSP